MSIPKNINKITIILIFIGLLLTLFSSCNAFNLPINPESESPANPKPSPTPKDQNIFANTQIDKPGPLLLIQTDIFEFQFLNPVTGKTSAFDFPIDDLQFRLQDHQSPSGNLMLIPSGDSTGKILDLQTAKVAQFYDFKGQILFNPEEAAAVAEPLINDASLSHSDILQSIIYAHDQSTQLARWFQSDRFHLSVKDTGSSSTGLFLNDHQTDHSRQLEAFPGFVYDVSISPFNDLILLKKGFIFTPTIKQDKLYYLVDANEFTTQSIQIPSDIINPSLFWVSNNMIGMVHRPHLSGGSGFTLYDVESHRFTRIIDSDFQDLRHFHDLFLVFKNYKETNSTVIELVSFTGESIAALNLEKRCRFQAAYASKFMIQCESTTYILDKQLGIKPFVDSFTLLSPSPDGQYYVMVNHQSKSFLLDDNFQIITELNLQDTPLEILWLGNAVGFIYRSLGQVYFYNLPNQTNNLLFESDIYSDYTNLNVILIDDE